MRKIIFVVLLVVVGCSDLQMYYDVYDQRGEKIDRVCRFIHKGGSYTEGAFYHKPTGIPCQWR